MTRSRHGTDGPAYDTAVAHAAARSLGWDAAYCAVLGGVAVAAPRVPAEYLDVEVRVMRGAGLGTLVWAAWLGHRAYHGVSRSHLRAVAGANLAAVVFLLASDRPRRGWRSGLAGDIGLFALRQVQLLHRSHVRR